MKKSLYHIETEYRTLIEQVEQADGELSPEVEEALICEPLANSKEFLLSVVILAIIIQSGSDFIINFTFFTKFDAVLSLVATTKMFLSL